MIADDTKLWEEATLGTQVLKQEPREETTRRPVPKKPATQLEEPKNPEPFNAAFAAPAGHLVEDHAAEKFSAHAPGLNKKTWLQLQRGEIPIQSRQDLHGLLVDDAFKTCAEFLWYAQEAELRCVLIIHGKGQGRAGPIKQAIPLWLAQNACVLAFHTAQPRHGGAGAVYVLLRRKKLGG